MFDKKWFIKHQKKLLWLLNTPLVRIWFRWVLRINGKRSSVGENKVIGILPNAIFWQGKKKNEYVAEFRTHDKFSKRLIYTFYPIWKLIHLWDTLIANNFQPALNLGFDQLTFYTNSEDGYCGRGWVSTWSDARGGAGQASDKTSTEMLADARFISGPLYLCRRAFALTNTSSIPDASTIVSADWHLFFTNGVGSGNLVVCQGTQGDTLETADFQSFVRTDYGRIINPGAGWFSVSLNSSGIGNISKTGNSYWCFQHANDFDNNTPTSEQTLGIRTSESTDDPYLVVNFTSGGSFLFNFI